MNDNGYIRKIDELGRIVIPKELRQRLKINEGENLIINCSEKNISLSKYSYIENNNNFINLIGDKTAFLTGYNVIITDLSHIIYSNKQFSGVALPDILTPYINRRESALLSHLDLTEELKIEGRICLEPIISNSMSIGLVIIYSDKNSDYLIKTAKLIASIISIHIDIT